MNQHTVLVAETGSDIPPQIAEQYGIYLVPMHVSFGNQTKDDGSFPAEEICDYFNRTGQVPKTSGCTPEDFHRVFERVKQEHPGKHISSVELNPDGENVPVQVDDIAYTVLYNGDGDELLVIEGGYLDIGLIDTTKDLFVNMVGALVFSIFGYLYIARRDKYRFAGHFKIVQEGREAQKGGVEYMC